MTPRVDRVQDKLAPSLPLLVTNPHEQILQPLAIELDVPVDAAWCAKLFTRKLKALAFGRADKLQTIGPKVSQDPILQLRRRSNAEIALAIEHPNASPTHGPSIYHRQTCSAH